MKRQLLAVAAFLLVAACGGQPAANLPSASPSLVAAETPSPEASPSPSASPVLSPSPAATPTPALTPAAVPAWAAMKPSCSGALGGHEAVLVLKGATKPVVADVTDPAHPRTICTLTGSWQPQLVTQSTVSWWATENRGGAGQSAIVSLSLVTGTSAVVAKWAGGGTIDGLSAWSPDLSSIAYVTSDASAVKLHLLSGGGDRVVGTFGAVPGRGGNPLEDDAFLGFSADGHYFALVQTFTSGGDHLQVRRTSDGAVVYSQANGTMAAWSTAGSKLFFRSVGSSAVKVWTSTGGATQAFAQAAAWISPDTDAGDDYIAYTVRDSGGIPHVWTYGHDGRAGGELPNVRSGPVFLNTETIFMLEEAPCGSNCGPGPATQPDGKTYTFSLATMSETASNIVWIYGTWPRLGQK